jgi:hypothetical protein
MRLQEMNGQLEGSNSLKSWNAELLRELAGLRWVRLAGWVCQKAAGY